MKSKCFLLCILLAAVQFSAQVSWQVRASFPGAGRNHAIAFSHGTMGYVMTGVSTSDYKDFWQYNSLTDTWTQLPDYPGPKRSYGVGYVINDKAYIGLGHTKGVSGYCQDWWQYDFNTSVWTQKSNFPGPGRDHPNCEVANGMLYMGFGDNNSGNYKDWWQYNPTTDTWTSKATYPGVTMHHPVAASSGGKIYVTQGHLESGSTNHGSTKTYSYDPASNTWATLANMPGPGVVAGASFAIGNKVYSGAGIEEPVEVFHNEFYEYNIATNTWASIANHPGTGWFGPVSFIIGNDGYVITGMDINGNNTKNCYRLHSTSTTGIEESIETSMMRVFPNPVINTLTLENEMKNVTVELYTISGVLIQSFTKKEQTLNIDMNNLPDGLYILRSAGFVQKVIKQ